MKSDIFFYLQVLSRIPLKYTIYNLFSSGFNVWCFSLLDTVSRILKQYLLCCLKDGVHFLTVLPAVCQNNNKDITCSTRQRKVVCLSPFLGPHGKERIAFVCSSCYWLVLQTSRALHCLCISLFWIDLHGKVSGWIFKEREWACASAYKIYDHKKHLGCVSMQCCVFSVAY